LLESGPRQRVGHTRCNSVLQVVIGTARNGTLVMFDGVHMSS